MTHSTGNHGQALAYAAQLTGTPCVVVVPHDTPAVKVQAILQYEAEIVFSQPTQISRLVTVRSGHDTYFCSGMEGKGWTLISARPAPRFICCQAAETKLQYYQLGWRLTLSRLEHTHQNGKLKPSGSFQNHLLLTRILTWCLY